jgi:hypothetical protein
MGRRLKRQARTKTAANATCSNSTFNASDLKAELLHRPAIKAVIWGMPALHGDIQYSTMFDDTTISKRRKR